MQFTVERMASPGWCVLDVWGELDLATVDRLLDAVHGELRTLCEVDAGRTSTPTRVVVNLGPTRFIDSTGAWALVRAARATDGTGVQLSVVCPPENRQVRRVLDLLQLHTLVPIVDALPAAAPSRSAAASVPAPRTRR